MKDREALELAAGALQEYSALLEEFASDPDVSADGRMWGMTRAARADAIADRLAEMIPLAEETEER